MTIKLSTTNSVNKTLQHKALWDLETPYGEMGDGRGCSYEGIAGPRTREEAPVSRDGTAFSQREIHRNLHQFMRSATWRVETTAVCPVL